MDFLLFDFDVLFYEKLVFKTKQHAPGMCGMYTQVYKPSTLNERGWHNKQPK